MRKVKVWTLGDAVLIYCRSHLVSYCLVREGRLPMLLLVWPDWENRAGLLVVWAMILSGVLCTKP